MKTAKLSLDEWEVELPVTVGSEGEVGLGIQNLRAATGAITLDSGYGNTGSCESTITFIDGEKSILRYRGYSIEDLAAKATFLEVAYLLIFSKLPTAEQLDEFSHTLSHHSLLHEDMKKFFEGYPRAAPPMSVLSTIVSSLSAYYPPGENEAGLQLNIMRLLAKLKTIAAFSYKKSIGQPYIYPRNDLGYSADFLHMMFAVPSEEYVVSPLVEKTLDTLLVLHADHEQNCSTSTVRMVGSSDATLFASISAGISALSGPLHGGANMAVIEMLEMIERDNRNVRKYVAMAEDKNSDFRLMGFGHRVYKNFDPRARVIKELTHSVLSELGVNDPLLDIALELERIALSEDYFVERKLYPNVDFYSGILYRAMGIPTNMFTVMFALGRLPGWIAQWLEMKNDPSKRINRPRQIYTGPTLRDWVPVENRVA
jgi:citrate synthase